MRGLEYEFLHKFYTPVEYLDCNFKEESIMKIVKLLKIAAVSAALLGATSASAGISGSLHDLTFATGNTISADAAVGGDQLCVYCHTPHAASASFSAAPLWNKEDMNMTTAFTMYGANSGGTTVAGNAPDATPNSPSKACLSCHDGVSAINSVVNAPGSGLNTGYVDFGTGNIAFVMPAGVTQIGRDLTNDHPVSIAYNVGDASLKETNTTLTGWSGASTIADLLRTDGANTNRVECVSCHDPHLTDNGTFLRTDNAGSALCLGCHDK